MGHGACAVGERLQQGRATAGVIGANSVPWGTGEAGRGGCTPWTRKGAESRLMLVPLRAQVPPTVDNAQESLLACVERVRGRRAGGGQERSLGSSVRRTRATEPSS